MRRDVQFSLKGMATEVELQGFLETLLIVLDHVPNTRNLLLAVGDGLGPPGVERPTGGLVDLGEQSVTPNKRLE